MFIVVSWNNMDYSLQISSFRERNQTENNTYFGIPLIYELKTAKENQWCKRQNIGSKLVRGWNWGSWCDAPLSSQWLCRCFTERNALRDTVKNHCFFVHNEKFWCVVCFLCMSIIHKWGCGCVHTSEHFARPEQNLRCLPLLFRSPTELEALARLAALELMWVCTGSSAELTGHVQPCTAWHVYFKILMVLRLWIIIKK